MNSTIRRTRIMPLVAAALLAGSTLACLSDLRPDALRERTEPGDLEKGKSIVIQGAAAQAVNGNWEAWLNLPGVRVQLRDEWFGLADLVANSWPENPQHLDLRFLPGRDNSVLYFVDSQSGQPTGSAWGIHEWNTWQREGTNAQAEYVSDADIKFLLPTMQYFLEMGFRLPDGGIYDYAGEMEAEDGTRCHVVYVTWSTYEPNDTVDQYVAYYSTETGLLHHVDFTVRDQMSFITAAAYYSDYRDVEGYRFPYRIVVTDVGDPDSVIHRYLVDDVDVGYPMTRTEVAPDPDRPPSDKH